VTMLSQLITRPVDGDVKFGSLRTTSPPECKTLKYVKTESSPPPINDISTSENQLFRSHFFIFKLTSAYTPYCIVNVA
jgi:hypothetical protein